ncbi:MAG: IS5/IS1182 family transposase, partial [Cyanobacteria bacterium QS_4_48_99]
MYGYFPPWRDQGSWKRIHPYLRAWVRLRCKRPQSPWVAIADTQSGPLGCLTHRARGFDGGKWVKVRKRHVLVDSMGLFLAVVVTAAKLTSK